MCRSVEPTSPNFKLSKLAQILIRYTILNNSPSDAYPESNATFHGLCAASTNIHGLCVVFVSE